jgi:hypothetical protein
VWHTKSKVPVAFRKRRLTLPHRAARRRKIA